MYSKDIRDEILSVNKRWRRHVVSLNRKLKIWSIFSDDFVDDTKSTLRIEHNGVMVHSKIKKDYETTDKR